MSLEVLSCHEQVSEDYTCRHTPPITVALPMNPRHSGQAVLPSTRAMRLAGTYRHLLVLFIGYLRRSQRPASTRVNCKP